MKAYKELNKELPDPFPANAVHGHVGPVDHIPIVE